MDEPKWIGLIEGVMSGESNCTFEELSKIKNELPKSLILNHLKEAPVEMVIPAVMYDVCTGESIGDGCVRVDGDFAIPNSFIYHYEKYDIGIPKEYEEYLKGVL